MKKVVIADDNPDIRRLITLYLQRNFSIDTHECASVQHALDCLRKIPVSFLITDIFPEDAGGPLFLQSLRQTYSHVPVVIFSGRSTHEQALWQQHALAYIMKPDFNALVERIKAFGTLNARD